MNAHAFNLAGAELTALPSGALWWAREQLLCASDLHLCKTERMMRRGGAMLPPYETRDTLARLDADIAATSARTVICLGDSFDDLAAAQAICDEDRTWLTRMQAGRSWIWVEGNHDPGPIDLGGSHRREVTIGSLTFRHIADPKASGELSGHYHPKARLQARGRMISRPCFVSDSTRTILPAYGTYTGGLDWTNQAFAGLFGPDAQAFLTGRTVTAVPLPHRQAAE
jgi:DNA ligase-associated metallophosphoesterase